MEVIFTIFGNPPGGLSLEHLLGWNLREGSLPEDGLNDGRD
jgi:hypothetical protein